MSADGAHRGIDAQRALETILGGKPHPKKKEEKTRDEVRARLMAAPTPEGPSPKDYGDAADAIARAFLSVLEQEPATPPLDGNLYDKVIERCPRFDDWVGGATGFQVGWAINCVRWLCEQPPVANPALLTIEK